MFGFFKKRTVDLARERGWKGICIGCSYPIRGMFAPAVWRSPSEADKSRAGTLFACHCPSCGVGLLAWEPSICDAMDGPKLFWNMHAVEMHYGDLITEEQVVSWSESSAVVE